MAVSEVSNFLMMIKIQAYGLFTLFSVLSLVTSVPKADAQELGVKEWECASLGRVIIMDATPNDDVRKSFSDNLVLTFSNGAKANLVGEMTGVNIRSWESPSTGIGFSYSPRPTWNLHISFSRDIFGYRKGSYSCMWK